MRTVVFGTRGSDLALTQTREVIARFRAVNPTAATELRIIKTTGDRKPDAPLVEIGGLGAFTREIEDALLHGAIDAAVHSLKDLPTRQPEGLVVAVIAERVNPADVLISRAGNDLHGLPSGALVGTSSLRRRVQLLAVRPDLHIHELRGNVPTRLGRVREGRLDAVILAAAGLMRLGLRDQPGMWELPLSLMLPAPGQGALAIEIRADDTELARLLAPLHDERAWAETGCERAVLQAFGGGCRAPLGTYAHGTGRELHLEAFAADEETGRSLRVENRGSWADALELGRQAGAELRRALNGPLFSHRPSGAVLRGPLHKRRIVVTRADSQSTSFVEKLEAAGAEVYCLPLIHIETIENVACPDRPDNFDWVVFTSVNAVRCFAECLRKAGRSLSDFECCRVAAIGQATADALQSSGLKPELTAEPHIATALAAAVVAADSKPAGKRVLLPRSNKARPVLAHALAEHGMAVTPLDVYRNVALEPTPEDRAALMRFAPDSVTFFSPSAVTAFLDFARDEIVDIGPNAVYASIGPVTTEALRQAGFEPVLEAVRADEDALVKTLVDYFT